MKKKHDKIILLAKTNLNSIEILVSRASSNSYIIHDQFGSVNNVLRKYDDMEEEIKNLKTSIIYQRF